MDEYGAQVVTVTVDQLSERIMSAYITWLVNGRGLEGITEAELVANIKRLPPARWVAMYCENEALALDCLASDPTTRIEGYES